MPNESIAAEVIERGKKEAQRIDAFINEVMRESLTGDTDENGAPVFNIMNATGLKGSREERMAHMREMRDNREMLELGIEDRQSEIKEDRIDRSALNAARDLVREIRDAGVERQAVNGTPGLGGNSPHAGRMTTNAAINSAILAGQDVDDIAEELKEWSISPTRRHNQMDYAPPARSITNEQMAMLLNSAGLPMPRINERGRAYGVEEGNIIAAMAVGDPHAFREMLSSPDGNLKKPYQFFANALFVELDNPLSGSPSVGYEPLTPSIGRIAYSDQRSGMELEGIVPVYPAMSRRISWLEEGAWTGAAAPRAQGGAMAEASRVYTRKYATLRSIDITMPIPEELDADVMDILTLVNGTLLKDLKQECEEQWLWGAGTGENLIGLLDDNADTQITNTDIPAKAGAVEWNSFDELYEQISAIRTTAYTEPDWIIAGSNADRFIMNRKDGEDRYIYGAGTQVMDDGTLRVRTKRYKNATVLDAGSDANSNDKVVVGDFGRGSGVYRHIEGGNVELGLSGDDFAKRQFHVRVGVREAFVNFHPTWFRSLGRFSRGTNLKNSAKA